VPLSELLVRLRKLDASLRAKKAALPSQGFRKIFFDIRTLFKTLRVMRGAVNLKRFFGDSTLLNASRALLDLVRGQKIDKILSKRTSFRNVLTLITIPYEDKGGLEDARLKDCPAVFAYEDVATGRIRTTAFCSWQTIKDEACRNIQDHYDKAASGNKRRTEVRSAVESVNSAAPTG
jgi:hypothetical protein